MKGLEKNPAGSEKIKSVEEIQNMKRFWIDKILECNSECYIPTDIYGNNQNIMKLKSFQIDGEVYKKIKLVTRGNHIANYVLLLAAYNILIAKYADEDECVISTPAFSSSKVRTIQGNWIFFRSQLLPQSTFREFLNSFKSNVKSGFENQFCSVDELIDELKLDNTKNTLKRNMFIYDNIQSKETVYHIINSMENYLTLQIKDTDIGLDCEFMYNSAFYLDRSADEFTIQYLYILEQIMSNLDIKIEDILLKTEDISKLAFQTMDIKSIDDCSDRRIKELFDSSAHKFADNVAIVNGDEQYTYKELSKKANRLAAYLLENNISCQDTLAIMVAPTIETIVGILAAIKIGATFVPIEPSLENKCIETILLECGAKLVFVSSKEDFIDSITIEQIDLSENKFYSSRDMDLPATGNGNDRFCIIYEPLVNKELGGIILANKSIINYLTWFAKTNKINDNSSMIMLYSFEKLMSYTGLFSMLLSGGSVHLLPKRIYTNINKLSRYILSNRITTLNCTNHLFHALIKNKMFDNKRIFKYTSMVVLNGYDFKISEVQRFFSVYPSVTMVSQYGSTETTVAATADIITSESIKEYESVRKLGSPISNVNIIVLNKKNRMVPTGAIGEICIFGEALSIGYVNEELNKERFNTIEINGEPYYIYRTGDFGKYMPSGEIAWIGTNNKESQLEDTAEFEVAVDTVSEDDEESEEVIAPRNEKEQELLAVFSEVLGHENIGIRHNFFYLGGDSIKAIQIIGRLKQIGYDVDLETIFKYQTIEKISDYVHENKNFCEQGIVTGTKGLLPIQKMFFMNDKEAWNQFNHSILLFNTKGIDEIAAKQAFDMLVNHHDALRMIYHNESQGIVQENRDDNCISYQFEVEDLRNTTNSELLMREDISSIQTKLNLFEGRLSFVKIYKTPEGDYLSITIHHMVVDGVSWRIILEDFQTAYNSLLEKRKVVLPAKTTPYINWVEEVEEYSKNGMPETEFSYWKTCIQKEELLSNREVLSDYVENHSVKKFVIDEVMTNMLINEVNKAFNTNINDILISILSTSLNQWKNTSTIGIMMEGHGRQKLVNNLDLSRTVGWFTSYYPVVVNVNQNQDIGNHIKNVKETIRKIPNKGIGYGIFKYLMNNESSEVFKHQVLFNYLGQADDVIANNDFVQTDIQISNAMHPNYNLGFPMCMNSIVLNHRFEVTLDYNKLLYSEDEIQQFIELFMKNMQQTIEYCANRTTVETTVSDYEAADLKERELELIKSRYGDKNIEDIYTLSLMQEGMLFLWSTTDEKDMYCEQYMYEMEGQLDEVCLNKSIKQVIENYQILRTVFLVEGLRKPHQIVLKNTKFHVNYLDFSEEEDLASALEEYRKEERLQGFDLLNGPMIRISVLQIASNRFNILFSFHHIIMDGWSVPVLLQEILKLYMIEKANDKAGTPSSIQFKSYIEWLNKQDKKEAEEFWRGYVKSADTVTGLPYQKKSDNIGNSLGNYTLTLNQEIENKLQAMAAKHNTTLYQVFQAMWSILLSKYNRSKTVSFGSVISGRPVELKNAEQLIGLCINTVPVIETLSDNLTFAQLLSTSNFNNLIKYGVYPLAEIQNLSELKQDLITHILIFENYPIDDELKNDVYASKLGFKLQGVSEFWKTNFDFNLMIVPNSGIELTAMYNENKFNHSDIVRILAHLNQVIEVVINNPEILLQDIEIITQEEKQVLKDNAYGIRFSLEDAQSIDQMVSDTARKNPEKRAVTYKNIYLTYGELERMSDSVASALIKNGVKARDIVGVLVNRTHKLPAILLGILKVGAAYLPIDKSNPKERINYMLQDSKAVCVIVSAENSIGLEFNGCVLDEDRVINEDVCKEDIANCSRERQLTDLMYMIYTSGSTGTPKAVCLEHKSVYNFIRSMEKAVPFIEYTKMLCVTTIAFDIFVLEAYYSLIYGYEIVIADENEQINPLLLAKLISDNGINTIQMTPSRMKLMLEEKEAIEAIKALEVILLGGEAVTDILLSELKKITTARIINVYGPTETTVWSSSIEITDAKEITIGRPIGNTSFYIIDDNNNLVPQGIPGELAIGGLGLARGYYNNDELTKEKFIHNPFEEEGRVYKTGDIVVLQPDGLVKYIERKDFQLKMHGYRVELGEIESCVKKKEEIVDAVVLPVENNGETIIVCYYVKKTEINIRELTASLRTQLPHYMVPASFIEVEKIPTNSSGKVDRKALAEIKVIDLEPRVIEEPADEIEKVVLEVWSKYLPDVQISVDDNFFDIGGHSLKAIYICSMLKSIGFNININNIYEHPTIRELSNFIKEKVIKSKLIDELSQLDQYLEKWIEKFKLSICEFMNNECLVLFMDKHEENHIEVIRYQLNQNVSYAIRPEYIICLEDYDKEIQLSGQELLQKYLPRLKAEDVIHEFKLDYAAYKESIKNQFSNKEIKTTFQISGAQQLRLLDPQNIFTYIDVEEEISTKRIKEILLTIINEQDLFRSKLVSKGDNCYAWEEYGEFEDIFIPVVDFRGHAPEEVNDVVAKVIHIMNEGSGSQYDTPLYRAVFLRFNERKSRLLFVCNHIIFDGFSSQVMQHRFNSILKEPQVINEKGVKQYQDYVKAVALGPDSISDKELNDLFELDKFKQTLESLNGILEEFDTSSNTAVHFEIDLDEKMLQSIDFFKVSLKMFEAYIYDTFHISEIPMVMINYGRDYGINNYYESFGEYIDYIPFYFDLKEGSTGFTEKINRNLAQIREHNINFAELITNKDIQKKYRAGQNLFETLTSKTYFIFNYQGIDESSKDELTDIIEQETDYKMNSVIRISTKVVRGKFNVYAYFPFKLDNDKISNLERRCNEFLADAVNEQK